MQRWIAIPGSTERRAGVRASEGESEVSAARAPREGNGERNLFASPGSLRIILRLPRGMERNGEVNASYSTAPFSVTSVPILFCAGWPWGCEFELPVLREPCVTSP